MRACQISCWMMISLCFVTTALGEISEASIDAVVKAIEEERSLVVGLEWADGSEDHRKFEQWKKIMPRMISKDTERNHLLFAIFARSCLFAPRDAINLLNSEAGSLPLGKLLIVDSTRSHYAPLNVKKRYLFGGAGTLLGVSLASEEGKLPMRAIMYIGLRIRDWKIGDPIRVEDIDFVNTEFEMLCDSRMWKR